MGELVDVQIGPSMFLLESGYLLGGVVVLLVAVDYDIGQLTFVFLCLSVIDFILFGKFFFGFTDFIWKDYFKLYFGL